MDIKKALLLHSKNSETLGVAQLVEVPKKGEFIRVDSLDGNKPDGDVIEGMDYHVDKVVHVIILATEEIPASHAIEIYVSSVY